MTTPGRAQTNLSYEELLYHGNLDGGACAVGVAYLHDVERSAEARQRSVVASTVDAERLRQTPREVEDLDAVDVLV